MRKEKKTQSVRYSNANCRLERENQASISTERIPIIKCKFYCNYVRKGRATFVSIRRPNIIFLNTFT